MPYGIHMTTTPYTIRTTATGRADVVVDGTTVARLLHTQRILPGVRGNSLRWVWVIREDDRSYWNRAAAAAAAFDTYGAQA